MKVYLDHNSTTPLLKPVRESIIANTEYFGNPSSLHTEGAKAKRKIEEARSEFAKSLNKDPNSFIFTSSATESNNSVLKGVWLNSINTKGQAPHIITSTIEHPSIMNTCKYLEEKGAKVTYIPVDNQGFVDTDELRKAITPKTALISIMYANNETGTIQPMKEIIKISNDKGIPLHTDAVQSFMKIDMITDGIDFITVGGHKLGAPKGIGALFYNPDKIHIIDPLLHGGHQENDLRASTENMIYICAFAEAVKALGSELDTYRDRTRKLTFKLKSGIEKSFDSVIFNGSDRIEDRLPNTLNFAFEGIEGQELMLELDSVGIAVSTGSACSSANSESSYVLRAMGKKDYEAYSSIRFSTGYQTTEKEIDYVLKQLEYIITELRSRKI